MPSVNGKSGAPHPCMVAGARWALAWSQTKIKNIATGVLERPSGWMTIADNYHMPPRCRSPLLKETFTKLRSQRNGFQIYLDGGVRLVSPLYNPLNPVPEAVSLAIADSGNNVKYIKDVAAPLPPADEPAEVGPPAYTPDEATLAASVAHSM